MTDHAPCSGELCCRRTAGFSLLEVVIASAILALVVLATYGILYSSSTTYANQSVHVALDDLAREVLSDLARDLREAGKHTLTTGDPPAAVVPGTPYTDLRLGVHSGFSMADRKPLFADTVRYRWVPARGETVDGKDNNRDGFVDEGEIEKMDRFGAVTRICPNVLTDGLKFTLDESAVTVSLELARRDARNTLVSRRAETRIELRN
jgi:prepilin-type N-terminal cleavage/methylation domain-containing protein